MYRLHNHLFANASNRLDLEDEYILKILQTYDKILNSDVRFTYPTDLFLLKNRVRTKKFEGLGFFTDIIYFLVFHF